MVRVTRAPARKRRIKRLLKAVKGFVGDRNHHQQQAQSAVMKAWSYAFSGRKERKRDMRALWIQRINPAARMFGMSYSRLIDGLTKANVDIDRKMLAQLANEDIKAFEAVVNVAKKALA